MRKAIILICFAAVVVSSNSCAVITAPYYAVKGVVQGGVWTVKTTYEVTAGGVKVVYRIGDYTYQVVKAPIEWALTHDEIQTMGGIAVKQAIRLGKVKTAPYVVGGKLFVPMALEAAQRYREEGVASWYGFESGRMTANGEVFYPEGYSAAHKYLPIPMFVKVTNLANGRSMVVRVNDRGPFPSERNPRSGDRVIDLSMGAAKELGFYGQGLARVRVEAVPVDDIDTSAGGPPGTPEASAR